jgi:tetratricopeptide (TPR) repeat protein
MNRILILGMAMGFVLCVAMLASSPLRGNPGLLGLKAARYPEVLQVAASQVIAAPEDQETAMQAARLFINTGRKIGDASLVQSGLSALQPALKSRPDARVLILAAVGKQYMHDFDGALELLDHAETLQPRNPTLLLTRANILVVQGHTMKARPDCRGLARAGTFDLALICAATTEMLSPNADAAYDKLDRYMELKPVMEPALRGYAHSVLAEIAMYHDWPDLAAVHFVQAIRADPDSIRSAALYADFRLRRSEYEEALDALRGKPPTDAVLVRRAIACSQLKKSGCLLRSRRSLQAHLLSEKKIGSFAHAREEARYLLDVEGKPLEALERARLNWTLQREFEDADVLLRAARGADDMAAEEMVKSWVTENGFSIPALSVELGSHPHAGAETIPGRGSAL